MLCIFKSVPKTETHTQKDAGRVQAEIEAVLPRLEHDPTVRHTIEGANKITKQSIMFNNQGSEMSADDKAYAEKQDPEFRSIMGVTTGDKDLEDVLDLSHAGSNRKVHISPTIDGITVESFKAGASFGNGVTCNVPQRLRDGTEEKFSWCIFPKGTTLTVEQLEQLRVIFETPVLSI